MKRIFLFILTIIVATGVCACAEKKQTNSLKAQLVVSCSEVVENLGSEEYAIKPEKLDIVPESGIIFNSKVDFGEKTNAFDLLVSNLKDKKIHFEAKDGYIKGISNIYEGDCGKFSGWMFYINGNLSEVGSTDYIVQENDVIEFKYVVDYMKLFEYYLNYRINMIFVFLYL